MPSSTTDGPLASRADAVREARRVAEEVVRGAAERGDVYAEWPEPSLRALQTAGLGGLVVPVEHGGLGLGLAALTEVCEAVGHADASTALCFGMHSVGTACIAAQASEEQARAYLRPIAAGRHLTTLALSEPGTGAHFYLPETSMEVADEGAYRVSGRKGFVTNGGHADSYVLSTVAADPGASAGHFSMVVVPGDAPGLEWGAPWDGWGMRGNSSRGLALHDVEVPLANLLGREGEQIWYVFQVVAPYFLCAMAGTYLGLARHALDEAVAHLGQRRYSHSGRGLQEVEILQHRLGRVWSIVQRARRLCLWAAEEADTGGPEALPALCSAKAEVAHTAVDVVNECMTLVGGIAYRDGSVLQRLLRDARAAHVMSPTTDLLYTWTGRAVLGLPLLGE